MTKRVRQRVLNIAIAAAVALIVWMTLIRSHRTWKCENPLANPVAVSAVNGGSITLVDGRSFRPAGVRLVDSVDPSQLDEFLRISTAQGVVLLRDLGDGTAFVQCEPRFYNWCGTSRTLAGSYFQMRLSELLVWSHYASADIDQPRLSTIERWRLEGVEHLFGGPGEPTRFVKESSAIRYSSGERLISNCDETLGVLWKAAPRE